MQQEQLNRKRDTGTKPSIAELFDECWTLYRARQTKGEPKTRELTIDPKLHSLVEGFLALYYSAPTGRHPDREALVKVLRALFPDPLAKQGDHKKQA
jgi:hypothetical protein